MAFVSSSVSGGAVMRLISELRPSPSLEQEAHDGALVAEGGCVQRGAGVAEHAGWHGVKGAPRSSRQTATSFRS